jgi:hypothetical protein
LELTPEHLNDITTNAVESAPVAADQPSYPVLIFLEGIRFSYRQQNTFQVEELVSHGYIVAAIDQPYTAATVVFPDQRRAAYDPRWDPPHSAFMDTHIPYLAQDAVFTLDQLTCSTELTPTASWVGGWTCSAPAWSACRWAPSWAARPAGWSGGCGPAC